MSAFTSRSGWVGACAAVALGSSLVLAQAKKPAATPAESPKASAAASVKLVKPWSELTTLSDDQKVKIHDLHAKALAQVNEIEKQEKADIMAVLTDAQKAELKTAMAQDRKETAERRATRAGDAAETPAKDTKAPAAKPEMKGK